MFLLLSKTGKKPHLKNALVNTYYDFASNVHVYARLKQVFFFMLHISNVIYHFNNLFYFIFTHY